MDHQRRAAAEARTRQDAMIQASLLGHGKLMAGLIMRLSL
jgi:hypothetical protein